MILSTFYCYKNGLLYPWWNDLVKYTFKICLFLGFSFLRWYTIHYILYSRIGVYKISQIKKIYMYGFPYSKNLINFEALSSYYFIKHNHLTTEEWIWWEVLSCSTILAKKYIIQVAMKFALQKKNPTQITLTKGHWLGGN